MSTEVPRSNSNGREELASSPSTRSTQPTPAGPAKTTETQLRQPQRGRPRQDQKDDEKNVVKAPSWVIFMMTLVAPSLLLLMVLLSTTEPVRWVALVHLIDRLAGTVSGGFLLVAVIMQGAKQATPVIVQDDKRADPANVSANIKVAGCPLPILVEAPADTVLEKYSGRLWSIALFAVVVWLLAAVNHLVLHYALEAAEGSATSISVRGLFGALAAERELQFLALQVAVLMVLPVCVVMEVAGSRGLAPRNPLVPRIYLAVLAYTALIPGALAELDQPVSSRGLLLVAHVIAAVAWAGGLVALLSLARLARQEVDDRFLFVIAALSSKVFLATALLVLLSGGALGLDGPKGPLVGLTTIGVAAIFGKAILGIALIGCGYQQGRTNLPKLLDPNDKNPTRTLCRLGLIELVMLAGCYAAGVALSEGIFFAAS